MPAQSRCSPARRSRLAERGPDVPKTLYGIFFEDINYSADGGIYPELVANRGFDWDNGSTHGWENDFRGGAQARISDIVRLTVA